MTEGDTWPSQRRLWGTRDLHRGDYGGHVAFTEAITSNETTWLPESRIRRDQGPDTQRAACLGHGEMPAVCQAGRHLGRNHSADTLISGFQPPELGGAKFLLFQLPSQDLRHSSSSRLNSLGSQSIPLWGHPEQPENQIKIVIECLNNRSN